MKVCLLASRVRRNVRWKTVVGHGTVTCTVKERATQRAHSPGANLLHASARISSAACLSACSPPSVFFAFAPFYALPQKILIGLCVPTGAHASGHEPRINRESNDCGFRCISLVHNLINSWSCSNFLSTSLYVRNLTSRKCSVSLE